MLEEELTVLDVRAAVRIGIAVLNLHDLGAGLILQLADQLGLQSLAFVLVGKRFRQSVKKRIQFGVGRAHPRERAFDDSGAHFARLHDLFSHITVPVAFLQPVLDKLKRLGCRAVLGIVLDLHPSRQRRGSLLKQGHNLGMLDQHTQQGLSIADRGAAQGERELAGLEEDVRHHRCARVHIGPSDVQDNRRAFAWLRRVAVPREPPIF